MGEVPAVDDSYRFAPAEPDGSAVYGACAPGWHSVAPHETAVEAWISFLRERGIRRICCLVPGTDPTDGAGALDRYRAAFGEERVLHAPVPDRSLAEAETLREEIFPFLRAASAAEPVVVHSLAGVGRTGHVLAAWLVEDHGYEPREAIETLRRLGRDPYEIVDRGRATRRDLLTSLARFE